MVRVSAVAVNPLTAPGDIVVGGGGSVTGYEAVAGGGVGPQGAAIVVDSELAGAGAKAWLNDNLVNNAPNVWQSVNTPASGSAWAGYDFGAGVTKRIGRFRIKQWSTQAGTRGSTFRLEWSDDGATWTLAETFTPGDFTDQTFTVANPAVAARYWRVRSMAGGAGQLVIEELWMEAVTTVGAGNQQRLGRGSEDAVLTIVNGAPAWEFTPPGAANPDTAATPAAGVGIAVNDASATLVALLTEHNALRTAVATLETEVNQLKALLRSVGHLSS